MILIHDIGKHFGKVVALDHIQLNFEKGLSYALIGPNGSGKTTLIKCILGMVIPTYGTLEVDGVSIQNQWRYREKIGYMPQIGHYPGNMRIIQLFEMMKNIRGQATLDESLIEAFGLHKIYDKRLQTLSGGTRQKISAALAFLFSPSILILDEPTAGLDPVSVEILKEKIVLEKKAGKLFLITSHILSDLDDLCSHIIYLFEGKVCYQQEIEKLKEDTGETSLGKAIARLMTTGQFETPPVY